MIAGWFCGLFGYEVGIDRDRKRQERSKVVALTKPCELRCLYMGHIWMACAACIIIDHFDGMITNEGADTKTIEFPEKSSRPDRSSLLSGVSDPRLYQTSSDCQRLQDADCWLLDSMSIHSAVFLRLLSLEGESSLLPISGWTTSSRNKC